MAVTRNAIDCPLPQVSTTLRLLSAAYASSAGTAPAAQGFAQGESANVRPKLNENALRLDLATRFGGGVRAVGQGLDVTAAGLVGTVAAGQCLIDGIAEIPASVTGLAMVDNTWNYFWVRQDPGLAATIVVTQSTTPPANSVFIGQVQTTGGVAGTPDTSGVVYTRGGLRLRETADATVPTDAPPALSMLYTRTVGGLYVWDGTDHQLAGIASSAVYLSTLPYSSGDATTALDTTGATTGHVLTVPATPGDPPEWAAGGTVTNVGLTLPADLFSVSGSPVTASGTLAGAFIPLPANTALMGPASGADATPTIRTFVANDIPVLDAAKITTGTFGTARLGSGAASATTVLWGNGAWAALPAASTTVAGIVELATSAETTAGLAVQASDTRLADARTPTGSAGGDLTGTYPNPTIAAGAVEYAAIQDVSAAERLLGRGQGGGSGDVQEISLGTGLAMVGTVLSATTSAGVQDIPFLSFTPLDNEPPASNAAASGTRNNHNVLAFDDSVIEEAVFSGIMPTAPSPTGNDDLRVRLVWTALSATSGDVVWRVAWERCDGSLDIDSDNFGTWFSGVGTANGTSGVRTVTDIICTAATSGANMPAPGERFRVKVQREASSGGDTMTADAQLLAVLIEAI